MKVSELVDKKNGEEVLAVACGKCGRHWSTQAPDARRIAEECCKPRICECGEEITDGSYTLCASCRSGRRDKAEAARFERAKKVKFDDYDGPFVYSDRLDGEGYHDIDSFYSILEDMKLEERPKYVWACKPMPTPRPGALDIMERLLADYHEEAVEQVDIDGLQELLDGWAAKQPQELSYEADYAMAVLLDDLLVEIAKKEDEDAKAEDRVEG
jgi:hypothetical protein